MPKIKFLGSGGAFTDFRENYHNNAIVGVGSGRWVLIDCGGTAVQSMKEMRIRPWHIEALIVTHLHGDHIAGIEQLAWERFYTGDEGPGWRETTIVTPSPVYLGLRNCIEPCINEYTPRDGIARYGGFDELFFVNCPGEGVEFTFGSAKFSFHRTPHVVGPGVDKPAYGVKIWDSGGSFYYTSDTPFRPNIGDLFPDVDLIFHDCAFYPHYPGTVHTHWEELLKLPGDVRRKTVIMHHTRVPPGVDVRREGFFGAAERHSVFTSSRYGVSR